MNLMPTTLALRFRAPRLRTTIFVTNRAATATTVISGAPCCAGNSDEAPFKCHLSVSRQAGIGRIRSTVIRHWIARKAFGQLRQLLVCGCHSLPSSTSLPAHAWTLPPNASPPHGSASSVHPGRSTASFSVSFPGSRRVRWLSDKSTGPNDANHSGTMPERCR